MSHLPVMEPAKSVSFCVYVWQTEIDKYKTKSGGLDLIFSPSDFSYIYFQYAEMFFGSFVVNKNKKTFSIIIFREKDKVLQL